MGPPVLVLMGVAGSGKSTVGAILAGRLGWPLAEGDDFHPPANLDKMAAGHPLDDEDRWPWLRAIGEWIDGQRAAGAPGIVACSALKHGYRDLLTRGRPEVMVVFLHGSPELIRRRLLARHGHFMRAGMLDSQLADLQSPGPDENALIIEVDKSPAEVADEVVERLGLERYR
jgi:gluconokinase